MENRRATDVHLELLTEIKQGLDSHLTSPGHQYLDVLMAREAKRAKLWDAIIEKTLSGLVYSMVVACFVGLVAWVKEHFKW